jgi:hypothetical protein
VGALTIEASLWTSALDYEVNDGLTGETSHDLGNDTIQVLVLWAFDLQLSSANLIKRFVLALSADTSKSR